MTTITILPTRVFLGSARSQAEVLTRGLLQSPGIFGFGTVLGTSLLPFLGPAGFLVPFTVGLIFSLGNFEGHVDFKVSALPNQQQRNIFHGRFSICKDILFGAFSTCLLDYADDNDSYAYMLPYDSAPGGIYDINQVSGNSLSLIGTSIPVAGVGVVIQPTFCFVPTTSALDIGSGQVALTSQDLAASYTNTAPPPTPRNVPFANFITGVRENLTHLLWNGLNSKWAFQEMQQNQQNNSCLSFCQASLTILGATAVCSGGTTYSIDGLPPGTSVAWQLATAGSVTNTFSANSPTFTTAFTGANSGPGTLTVTISSECGRVAMTKQLYVGAPAELDIVVEELNDCVREAWLRIVNYNPIIQYTAGSGTSAIRPDGRFRVKRPSYTISASNTCGTTSTTGFVEFGPCPNALQYAVYPNPADNALTIEQANSKPALRDQPAPEAGAATKATAPGTPYTIRLYDGYGVQRLYQAAATPTVQLRTGTLPTGLYLLHIEANGVIMERHRLQITH